MSDLYEKDKRLRELIGGMGSAIVAFSGGVDSAFLAVVAHQELGGDSLAITAESPSYPAYQREQADAVVRQYGLRHEFIASEELDDPNYAANPVNRCYFCKHELYGKLQGLAAARGFRFVADGTNVDDTGDYRPGRAAGEAHAVRSPLIEAGLGKAEIRSLSKELGLPTWDQPALACLASRIPYGSEVTVEKLRMIERGEAALREMGFRQSRVRHHGEIARIEIARDEIERALSIESFDRLAVLFKAIGFRFVALDVEGYRTGALNESLHQIQVSRK